MSAPLVQSPRETGSVDAPPTRHVGYPNLGDRRRFAELVDGIFERRWLTNNGPLVKELERRIAEYLGVGHAVAMCNGTVALELAIRALDLTGEVIVPSFTFVATAHALDWQGITPVFADIDPATHCLDPAAVEAAITGRTTGIIGVHCWGRPCDVTGLQAVADRHGLTLLFDAAHAFGCAAPAGPIGRFGRCEVLSFHATKCFNTGEGGAVTTDDDALAERLRYMRNFGFSGLDAVDHPGVNGKMGELHAALGLVNLDALDGFIRANRATYERYAALVDRHDDVTLVSHDPDLASNHHYVVLQVPPGSRDAMLAALRERGVLARRYFWPGCHRQAPYRDRPGADRVDLPATEAVAARVLVLPGGPQVDGTTLDTVAEVLETVR